MPALDDVLDAIARALLGPEPDEVAPMGSIVLRPHQEEALARVHAAFDEFGGALLADEPGVGKTFVALAAAREAGGTLVAAPAALRTMWRDAATRAGVRARVVTLEALSRRPVAGGEPLVIVDEAHHLSNAGTARYAHVARLCARGRVLLLSATPVRNRRRELETLLALFAGPRAREFDDAALARCVIRRRRGGTEGIPHIDGPHWHSSPRSPDFGRAIAALPPALPARDGAAARALVGTSLARAWSSSLAALDLALRRRVQRGAALESALDAGRFPTRAELRAWVIGEDAVQLAFPLMAESEATDADALRATLREHDAAVRRLRERVTPLAQRDARGRARLLRTIRLEHPNARILAITAFAATAEVLFHAMRADRGLALLTARGARTASGRRSRDDVLRAMATPLDPLPAARSHDEITLVVATDLLSEGHNLQGASVIVHLDVPWTPATLQQRVGRAARMGSPHGVVHVHAVRLPPGAERALSMERRHRLKREAQDDAARAALSVERTRRVVTAWRLPTFPERPDRVASASAAQAGFIAVVGCGSKRVVLAGFEAGAMRWRVTDDPRRLADQVESVHRHRARASATRAEISGAHGAIQRWLRRRSAGEQSGASDASSPARRRVLARLDAIVDRAPSHQRPVTASRVGGLRAGLGAFRGAGAEIQFREWLQSAAPDERWIEGVESLVQHRAEQSMAPSGRDEVLTLLILRARPVRGGVPPSLVVP